MITTQPKTPQVRARQAEPDGEFYGLVFLLVLIVLIMVPVIVLFTN
jgi:hypothetical protein